jgi:4-amino-4-deoxy-L-arabinose transferase-like glycosyltransferase
MAGLVLARLLWKDAFRLSWVETLLGICLTAGLTALWAVPALEQTHGEYFKVGMGEHVFHRSTGVIDGHGLHGLRGFVATFPLYFFTFLLSFLPWTLHKPTGFDSWLDRMRQKGSWWSTAATGLWGLLYILYIPIKIWRWWPERRRDPLGWYLLAQALVIFLVFSCVRTKLPHYTLPAFPCLALWLALQLRAESDAFAWFQKRLAIMTGVILALMLGFTSVARHYLLTENLWHAVQSQVRPETKVGCFGYTESGLVWKFRAVTTNLVVLGDVKEARDFLTNPPPLIVVLPTQAAAALTNVPGQFIPVHGIDMVKMKNWDLTAIIR